MLDLCLLATTGTEVSPEEAAGIIAAALGMLLVFFLITFGIAIVVCFLVYNAQRGVPVEHRKIEAGLIWLLLIPVFNLVWNFFVFPKISDSYKSYFNSVGRSDVGDCGRGVGTWYAICAACGIVPCVGYIAAPASLVLFIIFLVKIYGLKAQIPQTA